MEFPPASLGTTILAMKFANGVVIGADSKVTSGRFVSSRSFKKVLPVHHKIYAAMAGVASHGAIVLKVVAAQLDQLAQTLASPYETGAFNYLNAPVYFPALQQRTTFTDRSVEDGTTVVDSSSSLVPKKNLPTVLTAATLFQSLIYEYKHELTASIVVAGWDQKRGPGVYIIPLRGSLISAPYSATGSGSVFIASFLEDRFKEDLSQQECEDLVILAINHAILKDGASGGIIRLQTITSDAVYERIVSGDSMPIAV